MSLENVIVDLTKAIKENTEVNNLVLLQQGSAPVVNVSEEATEPQRLEKHQSDMTLEMQLDVIRQKILTLAELYAAKHEGDDKVKASKGRQQAVEVLKDVTGVNILTQVTEDQCPELLERVEAELLKVKGNA